MNGIRYDFDNEAPKSRKIQPRLLYVSAARYSDDWHSTPHCHPCAELFYVLSGKGKFRVDNDFFRVKADDLVTVNPLIPHTEMSLDDSPLEYVVLGVEGLEIIQDNNGDQRYCLANFGGQSETMRFCLKILLQEVREQKPDFEGVCQDILNIFLTQFLRRTRYLPSQVPSRPASRECAAVRRYIETHFKENLTLDILAQVAHVNKYHMAHAFSKEYGVSPISYLNSRRITESKTLLQTTDMSLSSISQTLGFSSPSYFSQSFRRHEGISPQAFRQKSK